MSTIESTTEVSFANVNTELHKSNEPENQTEELANKVNNAITRDEELVTSLSTKKAEDANKTPLTAEQLEKVAEQLQGFMGNMNRGLEFSVDKDSGRDVIKVLDKTSGELIKQYPSEEVLSLVAKLSEATGNFIDSKV